MHCHICDKTLTDAETQLTPDGKTYEPCAICMEIAMDAAYCDGFTHDEETVEETGENAGEIDTLELEIFRSTFSSSDYELQKSSTDD